MNINTNRGYAASAGLHPSELKRSGSTEYLFNGKGEMNASSKADVAVGQKEFLSALASGHAIPSTKNKSLQKLKNSLTS